MERELGEPVFSCAHVFRAYNSAFMRNSLWHEALRDKDMNFSGHVTQELEYG